MDTIKQGGTPPTTLADVLPQPGHMLWLIYKPAKDQIQSAESVYAFDTFRNGMFDLNACAILSLADADIRWAFDPETPHEEAHKFYA